MKNKIVVMFLTLIIMIIVTPFIFNKLMNSKFNTMLLKTQQQNGIVIKEKEDKSSYLTTNRVFEITIPGNAIGAKEIKYIKLLTEVKFKNLPVTNVVFHNIVKKFVLSNGEEVKFLENNLIFDVITPDFKHYKYKVVDKKVKEDGIEIAWSGFKGICIYPKECENEDGNLTLKNNNSKISLIHINSKVLILKNKFEQQFRLKKISLNAPNLVVEVDNIDSKNIKIDKKDKIDITSEFKVKKINANNVLKIEDIYSKADFNDINKSAIFASDEKRAKILLDSGFRGDLHLKVEDIFFLEPLGFLRADANFSVIKGNNFEKLQKNEEIDFINLNAKIVTSDKLLAFLGVSNPKLSSYIKLQNNKAIVEIKIKKGKIYINGKEIKSY